MWPGAGTGTQPNHPNAVRRGFCLTCRLIPALVTNIAVAVWSPAFWLPLTHILARVALQQVEEGCGLATAEEIAAAAHHVLCIIDAEAAAQRQPGLL